MTTEITLPPITSRRQSPYHRIKFTDVTGSLLITGGYNLEVPNHWELSQVHIIYSCVVDANNRYCRSYTLKDVSSAGTSVQTQYWISDAMSAPAAPASFDIGLYKYGGFNNMSGPGMEILLHDRSITLVGSDKMYFFIDGDVAGDTIQSLWEFRWLNWELGLDYPVLPGKTRQKGWFW